MSTGTLAGKETCPSNNRRIIDATTGPMTIAAFFFFCVTLKHLIYNVLLSSDLLAPFLHYSLVWALYMQILPE